MTLHDLPTDKFYILITAWVVAGLMIFASFGVGWWLCKQLRIREDRLDAKKATRAMRGQSRSLSDVRKELKL